MGKISEIIDGSQITGIVRTAVKNVKRWMGRGVTSSESDYHNSHNLCDNGHDYMDWQRQEEVMESQKREISFSGSVWYIGK